MGYYANGALLHQKDSAVVLRSGRDFASWALGQIAIPAHARVLDAGCGWGRFIAPLLADHSGEWDLLVPADASPGMLQTARDITPTAHALPFTGADLGALPFANAYFDVVMANHALYLPDDVDLVIAELARVLKPGGVLLATTNSDHIEIPVIDLHYAALSFLDIPFVPEPPSSFSTRNGGPQLMRAFATVNRFDFVDHGVFANRDAFVDSYLLTGRYHGIVNDASITHDLRAKLAPAFRELARERFPDPGPVYVPVEMCAFVCSAPLRVSNGRYAY